VSRKPVISARWYLRHAKEEIIIRGREPITTMDKEARFWLAWHELSPNPDDGCGPHGITRGRIRARVPERRDY